MEEKQYSFVLISFFFFFDFFLSEGRIEQGLPLYNSTLPGLVILALLQAYKKNKKKNEMKKKKRTGGK